MSNKSDTKQGDKLPESPRKKSAGKSKTKQTAQAAPVEEWPYMETLTEAEGHVLETSRIWARAQTDRTLRGELLALDLIGQGIANHKRGPVAAMDFAASIELSAKEAAALETIYHLWRRKAKMEAEVWGQ